MSINSIYWKKQALSTKETIKADEVSRIMAGRGTLWSEYNYPSFTKQKIWYAWCIDLEELAKKLHCNIEFGIIAHNPNVFTLGITFTYNHNMYFVKVTKDNLYFYRIEK